MGAWGASALHNAKYFSMRYTAKLKLPFELLLKVSVSLSLILCLFLLLVLCVIVSVFLLPPTCFNSFARQCRAWTYFFVYVCLSAALKAAFVLRLYKAIKLDNICGRHVEEHSLCCSTLAKKPPHSATTRTCEFLIKLYELYFNIRKAKLSINTLFKWEDKIDLKTALKLNN